MSSHVRESWKSLNFFFTWLSKTFSAICVCEYFQFALFRLKVGFKITFLLDCFIILWYTFQILTSNLSFQDKFISKDFQIFDLCALRETPARHNRAIQKRCQWKARIFTSLFFISLLFIISPMNCRPLPLWHQDSYIFESPFENRRDNESALNMFNWQNTWSYIQRNILLNKGFGATAAA